MRIPSSASSLFDSVLRHDGPWSTSGSDTSSFNSTRYSSQYMSRSFCKRCSLCRLKYNLVSSFISLRLGRPELMNLSHVHWSNVISLSAFHDIFWWATIRGDDLHILPLILTLITDSNSDHHNHHKGPVLATNSIWWRWYTIPKKTWGWNIVTTVRGKPKNSGKS